MAKMMVLKIRKRTGRRGTKTEKDEEPDKQKREIEKMTTVKVMMMIMKRNVRRSSRRTPQRFISCREKGIP